jgi:hypothetical protein
LFHFKPPPSNKSYPVYSSFFIPLLPIRQKKKNFGKESVLFTGSTASIVIGAPYFIDLFLRK